MMSAINLVKLPTYQESEQAKSSSRVLAKYIANGRLQLSIKADDSQEELILPNYAIDLLLNVLTEMAKGNAITLMPIHAELTTQEAAELLNVSRPHLVSLLEKGEIPFHKIGSHRRVLAKDIIEYKKNLRTNRLQALNELTTLSQTLGMGYE
ncbi:helix-turn-helix domain-containing protein [Beggiatoa leptomitoformis]|uniref:Excisionase family DNA-binding protein n=1 Tax=Beggiatoa leptomitoformis TaxID=288004 RepID=A0A2N9YBQ8_9GAMM|nr:helix-turn-helix domain-containing protein [Beggiatoa leptomitoformis]ALG66736.2 excisionase family DNA-binding protein [Beggiatoa leptomitoformis]AUI67927.2 excisionase family DNA-binding protein [Beggiatoa leptomitoformis]